MADDDPILLDWPRPQIARIRLNRPHRLNALIPEMVTSLTDLLRSLDAGEQPGEQRCRVIVLTGSGRGFCAGVDLEGASQRNKAGLSILDRLDRQEKFAGMIEAIRSVRAPVIAAVNGPAAGAGLALALAADIRIAAPRAAFHVAAVKIGLSAGECGISYFLPRLVGASRAFELMLTGRPVDAAEADRIGLVSRVVPADELDEVAVTLAESITANAPFSVWMTKQVMSANLDASSLGDALALENRTQILAVSTEDCAEAMAAFVAKRSPVFQGR
jgi:enoyl-CoA hydratase